MSRYDGAATDGDNASSHDEASSPLIIQDVFQPSETVLSVPASVFLLLKNGAPFFLTRVIELGTDFLAMSWLSKVGPDSAAAASLILASKIILRSVNATALMFAPYEIKNRINNHEQNRVGAVMFHNFIIATGLSFLFAPPMFFSESIFLGLNQPAKPAKIAANYLFGFLPGLPLTLYYISDQQCSLGFEYDKTVLAITVPVKFLTAFLGYGFMFGEWGLPKLEETGLAISNTIASATGLALFLAFFALNKEFKPYKIFWPQLKNSGYILINLLKNGLPIWGYAAVEMSSAFLIAILVGISGPQNLAAVQPALQFASIIGNLTFAFSQTLGIQINKKLKEHLFASARKLGYIGLAMAELLPVGLLIAYGFAGKQLMSLFLDENSAKNENTLNMGLLFLLLHLIGQIPDTIRNVSIGALRGFSDTAFPTAVNLLTCLLINVPSATIGTLVLKGPDYLPLIARNSAILVGSGILLNQFRRRSNEAHANPPDPFWSRTRKSLGHFISLFSCCGKRTKKEDYSEAEALLYN